MLKALKMPTTWCVIVIMFMTYGVIITYNYVVPYCTAAFGMSAALAAIMGYAANGFRFVGCAIGGQIADRKGLSTMMLADVILMIVGVAGILYTPRSMKFMWMLIISIALLCMFMYSAQALHYAVLEEGEYPVEIMGAVTFIISPSWIQRRKHYATVQWLVSESFLRTGRIRDDLQDLYRYAVYRDCSDS